MIAAIVLMLSACIPTQSRTTATLLTLSACSNLPPAPTNTVAPAKTGMTVPFEYFNQHIYLTIRVNGTPGMVFLLDSGSNKNILNLRTLHQLGMEPGNVQQERKVGFGDGRVRVARDEKVVAELNSIQIADTMSVVDLSEFERHFHHPIDGMLGFPFFQDFIVQLDFEHQLLSIFPRDSYSYRGSGIKMKLLSNDSFATIPVKIAGSPYATHTARVIVDTGSSMTMLLYKRFAPRLNLDTSVFQSKSGEAYGLNGYYAADRGSIYSLQIENTMMREVPVDFISKNNEIHPDKTVAGIIGNGILQAFQVVIFDFPHRNIIFELRPAPLLPFTTQTETMQQ